MKLAITIASLLLTTITFAQSTVNDGEIKENSQITYRTKFRLNSSTTIKPGQSSIELGNRSTGGLVGKCEFSFLKKSYTRFINYEQIFETTTAFSQTREITYEDLKSDLVSLGASPETISKLSSREEILVMLGQLGGKLESKSRNYVALVSSDYSLQLACETAKPVTNIGEFIEAVSETHGSYFLFDRTFP